MKTLSGFVVALVAVFTTLFAPPCYRSQAHSALPYQPPIDYSQEPFDGLVQKLRALKSQERESAVYYLGDRLRWKKHQNDLRPTYEALRGVFSKEKDPGVINVLWMTLSNLFRGKPNSAPALLFHEEKAFWLSILAESDTALTVQNTLFLVGYHKAEWADAAVVAALSFPNQSVRIEACKGVVSLKLLSAQPVLRTMLRAQDQSGSFHGACARALAKVGTEVAISDLTIAQDVHKSKGQSIIEYELAINEIKRRAQEKRNSEQNAQ